MGTHVSLVDEFEKKVVKNKEKNKTACCILPLVSGNNHKILTPEEKRLVCWICPLNNC